LPSVSASGWGESEDRLLFRVVVAERGGDVLHRDLEAALDDLAASIVSINPAAGDFCA
jgi:hypothetical protein